LSDELTAKQEAFAVAYVETGNGSKAYRLSHDVGADTKPETVWSNASRLLADSKVKARVQALQAEARDLLMVSVGTLTDELEQARKLAMKDEKGASAAVSATMGKAKLHGLLVDKAELTGKDGKDLMPDHSPRKLAKAVALILAKGMKEGNGSGA
jgi:phage terminase small subunit